MAFLSRRVLAILARSRSLGTPSTSHFVSRVKLPLSRRMHSASLLHQIDGNFLDWHTTLDNDARKNGIGSVTIQSPPPELDGVYDSPTSTALCEWKHSGQYPAFTDAVARIRELPQLTDVRLSFSDLCVGVENPSSYARDDAEPISARLRTLETVFKALQERVRDNPSFSRVRSLTIENLQNAPIPEFTTSSTFKEVMSDIEDLHLAIAIEASQHGPDFDLDRQERVYFEPYLHEHWLTPVAHQLSSLSLQCNECWGTAPGYFDGAGLSLPRLKKLRLGNLVISHHDHFDWVLKQQSLTHLTMDRCFIASHLRTHRHELEKWKIPRHDWKRLPRGSFGYDWEDDCIYSFPGTWETIFEAIQSSLTRLESFHFGYLQWQELFDPTPMSLEPYEARYIVLDTGLLPTPWIEAEHDGTLSFSGSRIGHPNLNKAKQHKDGDTRAFANLQQAISERRNSSIERAALVNPNLD